MRTEDDLNDAYERGYAAAAKAFDKLKAERDQLRADRDALAKACKGLREAMGMHGPCNNHDCDKCVAAYVQARAALARLGEKK